MKKYTVFAAILSSLALFSCNTEEHSGKLIDNINYTTCIDGIQFHYNSKGVNPIPCHTPENGKAICNADGGCDVECDNGYTKKEQKKQEEQEEQKVFQCEIAKEICSEDSVSCVDGDLKICTNGKEPKIKDCPKLCENKECIECTEQNLSACYHPENGKAKCISISNCDIDGNCNEENRCNFDCDEGFVKDASGTKCIGFICNNSDINNCTEPLPDHAYRTCQNNTCDFECDSGYIKHNNQCVICADENTSQCHVENAASYTCTIDNNCEFECDNKCYKKSGDGTKCELDTSNHECIVNCDDKDIVCIETAEQFIRLPQMVVDGKVKVENKSENASFIIKNDIHLEDVLKLIDGKCPKWQAMDPIENLKLNTENDSIKEISFSLKNNDEQCPLQEGLFSTLTNSSISNLKISLGIKGSDAQAALAQTVDNTTLTNITFTGSVTNTTKSGYEPNVAGIVGTAKNSTLKDVICIGVSVSGNGMKHETTSSENKTQLNESSYVAGVIGVLENSTYTMSADKKNTIKAILTNHIGSGFAGRAVLSTIKNVTQETESINQVCDGTNAELHCDVVKTAGYASGFVHFVQGGTFENVNNSSKSVQGEYVSGFVDSAVSDNLEQIQSNLSFTNINNSIDTIFCNGVSGTNIQHQNKAAGFGLHLKDIELRKITNNINNFYGGNNGNYLAGFAYSLYDCIVDEITNTITGNIIALNFASGFANSIINSPITNVKNDINSLQGKTVAGFGYSINFKDTSNATDNNLSNITNIIQKITASDQAAGFVHTSTYSHFSTIKNQINDIYYYNPENFSSTPDNSVGGFVYSASSSKFNEIENTIGTVDSKELGGFAYKSHASKYNKIYNQIDGDWSGTNFGGFAYNDINISECNDTSDCYAEYSDIKNIIDGTITPSGNGGGFIETINFSSDYTKSLKISKIINTVKSMTSNSSSNSPSAGGFINNIKATKSFTNLHQNNLHVHISNITSKVNINSDTASGSASGFIYSTLPITIIKNVKSIASINNKHESIGFIGIDTDHELVSNKYQTAIDLNSIYSQISFKNIAYAPSGFIQILTEHYSNNSSEFQKAYSNLKINASQIVSISETVDTSGSNLASDYNNIISNSCNWFDKITELCKNNETDCYLTENNPSFTKVCYYPYNISTFSVSVSSSACEEAYNGNFKFMECNYEGDDIVKTTFGNNWSLEKIPIFESDQVSITTDTKVPMLTPEEPAKDWLNDSFFKQDSL